MNYNYILTKFKYAEPRAVNFFIVINVINSTRFRYFRQFSVITHLLDGSIWRDNYTEIFVLRLMDDFKI